MVLDEIVVFSSAENRPTSSKPSYLGSNRWVERSQSIKVAIGGSAVVEMMSSHNIRGSRVRSKHCIVRTLSQSTLLICFFVVIELNSSQVGLVITSLLFAQTIES